ETGRAGFVMSSQASSAGGSEAAVRRKLVETGDVDVMIAIRSNFFYTRTVPCELWFLNRAKPERHRDKVLMLDARNVYRKVTRKICDFSPEQQQNLLAIVRLYRGETEGFLEIAFEFLWNVVEEGSWCFEWESDDGESIRPLQAFVDAVAALRGELAPLLKTLPKTGPHAGELAVLGKEQKRFASDVERFGDRVDKAAEQWEGTPDTNAGLHKLVDRFTPLAGAGRDLAAQADQLCKRAAGLVETCEQQGGAKSGDTWNAGAVNRARRVADEARGEAVEQLRKVDYFWRQARWLTERFPDGKLRDVAGLVKLVDRAEIEANDWSLTPGRYVGVAPEEEDADFDFATAMREIHAELADLDAEATVLAAKIRKNFEKLGI
ncbi:MAG: N-6 DNA methylase, partial [Acidobacteriota bacterium]|nr:N-6 DNA methylase [Acidobacteriota bacterium]